MRLARAVCAERGWDLTGVRFYTGVPALTDNPFWYRFWENKLPVMGRQGVVVYTRPLVYRQKTVTVPGFGKYSFLNGEEKGIDVRLALDVLDLAHRRIYDVAVIFSQDQDLSELASLLRLVAGTQHRWIKVASAFPDGLMSKNRRGINGTDWCPFGKSLYCACIDPHDYRPSPEAGHSVKQAG